MNHLEEILLGIVQGLTEFLPVSSSGHLVAAQTVLDSRFAEDLTFDILVHFATLVVVLGFYRRDVLAILGLNSDLTRSQRVHWIGRLLVGAIPAGLAGLFLSDTIGALPETFPLIVPIAWLFTAGILYSLKFRAEGEKPISYGAALWIGLWQILALLPGVSRSGTTIVAALWFGCRRGDAARFSFLCATPLIGGATALTVKKLIESGDHVSTADLVSYSIGGVAAGISGLFALKLLLRLLDRGALHRWAFYLVPLAIAYGGFLLTRTNG